MRNEKSNIEPGDGDCTTCTGITYFNAAMRLRREPAWCIGVKSSLKAQVPDQQLDEFERGHVITPTKDYKTIISIGNSITFYFQGITEAVCM